MINADGGQPVASLNDLISSVRVDGFVIFDIPGSYPKDDRYHAQPAKPNKDLCTRQRLKSQTGIGLSLLCYHRHPR